MSFLYNQTTDALLGIAIGDALGVPVEFVGRGILKKNPVQNMRSYGTHNQPAGTWSDDSSLTFCLAESLCTSYNIEDICEKFIAWHNEDYWTATGITFDVGEATGSSLDRLVQGHTYKNCGATGEFQNGNGSLMRILPLAFLLKKQPYSKHFPLVKEISSITHAHFRAIFSCFIYIEVVIQLLQGKTKKEALAEGLGKVLEYEPINNYEKEELLLFKDILNGMIVCRPETEIYSSGYVIHALEASLWCWLNSSSYAEAVLKAVNLGGDTDTTAAITGGLAALTYGLADIPKNWLTTLKRTDDIVNLGNQLNQKYS